MKGAERGKNKCNRPSEETDLRNIQLVLEYDGAAYSGFQRQLKKATIQGELEKALQSLFGYPMKIGSASGRTDAGVHASHQVVHLRLVSELTAERIQMGLNYYLPPDIAVMSAKEVPADFHARFSAKAKAYEYRIWNGRPRSPLRASRFHHVPAALSLTVMRRAAKHLVGEHDFSSFCSTGSARRNPVRHVKKLTLRKQGHEILMRIEANGFLYHMVRNIAGTLIEAGRGKVGDEEVRQILASKGKRKALYNAPAHALSLVSVTY